MNEFGYPENPQKPKFLCSHIAKEYSEWENRTIRKINTIEDECTQNRV